MNTIDSNQETPVIPLKNNRSSLFKWLSAAAAIAFIVVATYLLIPMETSSPMASLTTELIAFNESGTKDSAPNSKNSILLQGIERFKKQQYAAAIPFFDQVINSNTGKRATAQIPEGGCFI